MEVLVTAMVIFFLASSPLFPATSIQRTVEADELLRPVGGLGGSEPGNCGGLSQPLKTGDSIRITTGEAGARRDEPGVSLLFDARAERLLVVDHATRTFSELAVPLKTRVAFPFRATLEKEAAQILSFTLDGPVREGAGAETGAKTYQARFSRRGRGFEGILTCRRESSAAARSLAILERAVQQLRNGGTDWISALPASDCLVLSLEGVEQQPEIQVRKRENLVKVEEVDAGQLVLTPPDGYRKVAFPQGCVAQD